ncbi:hypothetical protein F2P81_019087 [Scophthalmus maximus]|uniref:Uncharacterized protein n=1 Tax=Scophthalmus maximus TaxID=52904 RepID=A0A6A4S8U1_SCOMX|nr:hypothetical protein F2P81_019087 [Scophthalmus maximus]
MNSVLHVSEMAIQDIVENLVQIFSLSKPLVRDSVIRIFQEHNQSISDAVLHELVEAIMKSNVFVSAELSTAKWRETFVRSNYPLVMPVQYTVDSSGHTAVYVPILQMLQTMFKNTDLMDKIQETKPSPPGMYMSHEDGTYLKGNQLLSEAGELKLSLILYVDDIELANPLGTSRKIHKLCAVYWLLGNVPSQYRSNLHVIQLALLCKVPDLQKCGYQSVLSPLLKDLCTLEEDGIFIETVDSVAVVETRCSPVKSLKGSLACEPEPVMIFMFRMFCKEKMQPTLVLRVCAEFHRIANINLKNHFYAELDRHAPRLQSLFRKKAARTGKVADVLSQLFCTYGLQGSQSDEPNIDDLPVGLLLVSANSTDATFFCPDRTAVVLEGDYTGHVICERMEHSVLRTSISQAALTCCAMASSRKLIQRKEKQHVGFK